MASLGLSEPEVQTNNPSLLQQYIAGMFTFLKILFDWVLLPIAIVFILHTFVFQAFHVDGRSMEPTLANSDYLIVSKVEASIARIINRQPYIPERGEVIIFKYPNKPNLVFVKRAVALPGERVVIKDGIIKIYNQENPNGISPDTSEFERLGATTLGNIDEIVPENHVFVLGDNREPSGSFDSRDWGTLPSDHIIGRAALRLLPLDAFKTFAVMVNR